METRNSIEDLVKRIEWIEARVEILIVEIEAMKLKDCASENRESQARQP